ncbi:unnamed protein product [Durusdinium trenchii]|uniref:Secreted protein n=1 Tax=Durusdinium trenchii TaxID=1381693 RepID=A0ABP0N2Q2_9DINO
MSVVRLLSAWTAFVLSVSQAPQDAKLLEYEVKACKHTSLPSSLETRAFTTYTGEVHVHDVFGLPSTVKRMIIGLFRPSRGRAVLGSGGTMGREKWLERL